MSRQSVRIHLQLTDHLDHDQIQTSTLSAQSQSDPRLLSYLESDGSTLVTLRFFPREITLTRKGAWTTDIRFDLDGNGSFSVLSDQGEMRGTAKVLKSRIESDLISLTYQLIMDNTVITHQTLQINIRGAQS